MKLKIVCVILIIFSLGCDNSIHYPDGGYDYPKHVADKDTNFYFYPVKDIMSKKEAFDESYAYTYYKLLDEPNLSLKPLDKPLFRLTYGNSRVVIISITENSIVVKEGNTGSAYLRDLSRLTNIEALHLSILERFYPLDSVDKPSRYKKYLDSMIKQYPQLLNPNYYHSIYEKSFMRTDEAFSYKSQKIPISKNVYDSIVKQINLSGFWHMPYKFKCKSAGFDGYSYSLEANTRSKYNLVNSGSCADTLQLENNFAKACQKIINYAHLEKEVFIWSDKSKIDSTKNIIVQDVQLPDVKEPQWHIKKRAYQPHKEQKVQGSDTTKLN